MKKVLLTTLVCILAIYTNAQDLKTPSFEEVISLQSISTAEISPDGKHIVFTKQAADWQENRYDRELWLSKDGETPFQLTNNPKGNSSGAQWSPDGKWIAFLSTRGEKNQIHAIRAAGGEALQITHTEANIRGFEWSPDGKTIAFLQSEDKSKDTKQQEEKYGKFTIDDEEYSLTQLWTIDFDPNRLAEMPLPAQMQDSVFKADRAAKLLLDDVDFNINDFSWSPDGQQIAIEHQPNPLINSFFDADISIYDISSKALNTLVSNESYDGLVDWSPDGKSILYQSALDERTSNYYLNGKLFRIDVDGSNNKQLAADFDEDIFRVSWNAEGIFALSWQKTDRFIIQIDPTSGEASVLPSDNRIWNYSFSESAQQLAITASGDDNLTEVYWSDFISKQRDVQITNASQQIDNWAAADSEVISWESKDGQVIEGVLHKPKDYDPSKKYPLLVIIHGGPTGISAPSPTPSYVYPMVQWLNKGALILRPNYRGSAGYGEAFRSLNVRNLGVGDAWDVLSGVEHLEKEGLIDGDKVGCMGWSQGGYISAFLTTNSDQFQAISVGAGISNWMTYYVNTDIHPFTRQYLKATPWSDQEIYELTSPMTNINDATTPTLIQHGEFDRRVPIANAYELVQGLRDVGVETELIVYKGFGHGISKPRERLAATWHNWQWFAKYIWGEEVELPEE
ncbi:MAG: S9 family peptidase [Bacteroidota bacterium]